jgi:hypothetical protein
LIAEYVSLASFLITQEKSKQVISIGYKRQPLMIVVRTIQSKIMIDGINNSLRT